MSDDNSIDLLIMLHNYLRARGRHDDDNSDRSDDFFSIYNENHCTTDEIEEIKQSFDKNREIKTPKKVKKPKPRELTEAEIIRLSEEEDKLTYNIRKYISNKKLLFEVLSELNRVDPKDPLFKEFY